MTEMTQASDCHGNQDQLCRQKAARDAVAVKSLAPSMSPR